MENKENKIVLDHGSYCIKYGFAGYNKPIGELRSIVAYENNLYLTDFDESLDSSDEIKTIHPIKNGIVVDYDKMIYLWDEIFYNKLKIKPKDSYLFLSEPVYHGTENREKIKKIMLQKYHFKGVQFTNQQILSLYGTGRSGGLVVDIGYDSTKIVPIYDSCILKRGIVISPLCKKRFELFPDINPLDIIENPSIINLDADTIGESIVKSITASPIDLRKILYQNMIVVGGGSKISGISRLILKSIRRKKSIPFNLRISAPKNRDILSWVGGSIFSSLPTFNNLWIYK